MFPLDTIARSLALAVGASSSIFSRAPSSTDIVKTGSEAACSAYMLSGPTLARVRLNATTYYHENTSISLNSSQGPLITNNLPAFCRLELEITTNVTAGSAATTEVWLPDEWNGRSLTLGNGGFTGGGECRLAT